MNISNGVLVKIAGYVLTAVWVVYVLSVTKGDMGHPLFDYIFLVPLAGWLIGLVVFRFILPRRR